MLSTQKNLLYRKCLLFIFTLCLFQVYLTPYSPFKNETGNFCYYSNTYPQPHVY